MRPKHFIGLTLLLAGSAFAQTQTPPASLPLLVGQGAGGI